MKYTKEAWESADKRFKQMKSVSRIMKGGDCDFVLSKSQCEKFG